MEKGEEKGEWRVVYAKGGEEMEERREGKDKGWKVPQYFSQVYASGYQSFIFYYAKNQHKCNEYIKKTIQKLHKNSIKLYRQKNALHTSVKTVC